MVRTNTFNKEEFKKDIKDNCKLLYRKNIDECDEVSGSCVFCQEYYH